MFGLVARLKNGIFGLVSEFETSEGAVGLMADLTALRTQEPGAHITFSQSPVFGLGMPFPVGAIAEMLILEQGKDMVPDHWHEKHLDQAEKFVNALVQRQDEAQDTETRP